MSEPISIQINTSQSGFHFSTVAMDDLALMGASEYTIAQVILDLSGSVGSFYKDLIDSMILILDACKKHPRSENVLLRVVAFNQYGVIEIHGFMPVNSIDAAIYKKISQPNGGTPFYLIIFGGVLTPPFL